MLERRSSADVSIAYLSVLQIGFALWIAYGIALGSIPLIVPNSVALDGRLRDDRDRVGVPQRSRGRHRGLIAQPAGRATTVP